MMKYTLPALASVKVNVQRLDIFLRVYYITELGCRVQKWNFSNSVAIYFLHSFMPSVLFLLKLQMSSISHQIPVAL